MICIEEEAKEKWCPFPGASQGDSVVADNCIASGCMAWRWLEVDPKDPDNNDGENTGFCGLSGRMREWTSRGL